VIETNVFGAYANRSITCRPKSMANTTFIKAAPSPLI